MDYVAELRNLLKTNDYFIGIDSDGCVFDTMEIKHKECFCPAFIKHFNLQAGSKYAREIWDFVNLYSKTRGCNRFLAVKHALTFMKKRKEFKNRNILIPDFPDLDAWLEEETKLGNPALEAKIATTNSEELQKLLAWSKEVNSRITDMVYGISPFPGVREVLDAAKDRADMIVVSQTPVEALIREWQENSIDSYVNIIAGQEYGKKSEHIKYAAGDKYEPEKILMVGDAPGDLKAAKENNALFFPVIPGREEDSWIQLAEEGLKKFFDGSFTGDYQEKLLNEFDRALPANPPWQ